MGNELGNGNSADVEQRLSESMRRLGLSRRDAARLALIGASGWLLNDCLSIPAFAAPFIPAKAKSVIQIWMWGGPCHLDTFDPKPDAGYDYCGAAGQADRHERRRDPNRRATAPARAASRQVLDHPQHHTRRERSRDRVLHGADGPNAWRPGRVSERRGGSFAFQGLQRGICRAYSALRRTYRTAGALFGSGIPGAREKPFATGGDPAQARFAVEGVVAQGISDERQKSRRDCSAEAGYVRTRGEGRRPDGRLAAGRTAGVRPDPRRRRKGVRPFAGEGRVARTSTVETRSVSPVWRREGWWSAASLISRSTTRAGTRTSSTSRP
jgi:hypothetical protein